MQRFKSHGSVQRFLSIQAAVQNVLPVQRDLIPRRIFKQFRAGRFLCGSRAAFPPDCGPRGVRSTAAVNVSVPRNESNDRDVGGAGGVLSVREFQRAGVRVDSKAFNAVGVLAGHKQELAARVQCQVSSVRVNRERVPG